MRSLRAARSLLVRHVHPLPGLNPQVEPILSGRADIVIGARPIDAIANFSASKKFFQRLGSWVVRCGHPLTRGEETVCTHDDD